MFPLLFLFLFLFLFVLFCFVLFCFVLFCFVLFCFVLFCFVLFCFVLFCFVLFCFRKEGVMRESSFNTMLGSNGVDGGSLGWVVRGAHWSHVLLPRHMQKW